MFERGVKVIHIAHWEYIDHLLIVLPAHRSQDLETQSCTPHLTYAKLVPNITVMQLVGDTSKV